MTWKDKREGPVENIKRDIDASMANVAEIVSSDSTDVHPYHSFHFGPENLLLSAHCVVQP